MRGAGQDVRGGAGEADHEVAGLRVCVGMLTFRRPEQLAVSLPEVLAQLEQLAGLTSAPAEVVIVDNDPDASARAYVAGLTERNHRVRYVHEPTPGIAAARRRCLAEATGADVLQFIDDDEIPAPGWLVTMVRTWVGCGRPAAVAGSVMPRYLSPPPEFVSAGGFFVRRQHPTGTELPAAPSGNLLLDVGQVRALDVDFDPRLGLRGGEDTLFTRELVKRGGRIVFCAEAAIYDLVPDERNTKEWVLQHAWHHGTNHSHVELSRTPSGAARILLRVRLAVGGAARMAVGGAKAATGLLTGSLERRAKGLRLFWRGRGILAGAVAATEPEYRR